MSNLKQENNITFKHLNLDIFKINPCFKKNNHNRTNCVYFHNKADKRRTMIHKQYKMFMNIDKNLNNSNYCLNKSELLYHPNFYKKKFCQKYYVNNSCNLGKFCSFIHEIHELRSISFYNLKFNFNFFIFFFKTEFCPFGLIKHNKKNCIYAHNYQDYKRKNINKLNPYKCENWNNSAYYYEYEEGCKKGINCKNCHGWKEFCYHPLNYKIKKCSYEIDTCPNFNICAYYHSEKDKRFLNIKYSLEIVPYKNN